LKKEANDEMNLSLENMNLYLTDKSSIDVDSIRFKNTSGTACWYNSAVVAIVYLIKKLGKGKPMGDQEESFNNLLAHWSQCESGVFDPLPSMRFFVDKYLARDHTFLTEEKEAETIFESSVEDTSAGRPGNSFLAFMQPSTFDTIFTHACCEQATHTAGRWQANNSLFMVDFPKDGVTLEDAIQNYFMVPTEIIGATCNVCKKPVKKSKMINFSDGKEALVVSLNRVLTSQKMNSIKTNKKIELGGSIAIPMTHGGPPAFYDLVATIQHLGKVRSTGHYVCHIKNNDCFYNVNDEETITISKNEDVKRSQIFLFKKNNGSNC
jgi:hypothetical protein